VTVVFSETEAGAASRPVLPDGAVTGGIAQRIVDATLRCVARWGVSKTTLDDVAREAGCGRATLYRLFPGGREALFEAVLATEASRLLERISARIAVEAGLEDVLVGAMTEAGQALSGHAALQFLFANEPEIILPYLAFHRMDLVLRTVARFGGPLLVPWLPPEDDGTPPAETAARGAEWIARILVSYLTSPSPDVDVCDEQSVRALVRQFVLPGLAPAIHLPA
jgi:AcrR family transcriptional regulator